MDKLPQKPWQGPKKPSSYSQPSLVPSNNTVGKQNQQADLNSAASSNLNGKNEQEKNNNEMAIVPSNPEMVSSTSFNSAYNRYGNHMPSPYTSSIPNQYGYGSYGMGGMRGYGGYGYGGMPPMGMDSAGIMNGPQSLLNTVGDSVGSFGRLSQLMHMNFESLHMSFSSFAQLLSNVAYLKNEFFGMFSTFSLLRLGHWLYCRFRRLFSYLLGKKLEDAWDSSTTTPDTTWSWLTLVLTGTALYYILKWIWKITRDPNAEQLQLEQAWVPDANNNNSFPNQPPLNPSGVQGYNTGYNSGYSTGMGYPGSYGSNRYGYGSSYGNGYGGGSYGGGMGGYGSGMGGMPGW